MKSQREVVSTAVTQNSLSLEHAGPDLQDDCGIVEVAIKQNPSALQFASPRLKRQHQIISIAAKRRHCFNWAAFFAREELSTDRDVAMTAVQLDSNALQFLS